MWMICCFQLVVKIQISYHLKWNYISWFSFCLMPGRISTRRIQFRCKTVSFTSSLNICINFDVLPSALEWRPYVMTLIMWFFRRRESTEVEDIFLAHISGMDTLARGLRSAAKLIQVRSLIFIFSTIFSWKVFLLSWFWCLWICLLWNKGWFIGWACSQTLSEFWYRNRGASRGNMLLIPILSCFLISLVANK